MSAPRRSRSPAPGSKLAPLQGSHRPWGTTTSHQSRQRRHRDGASRTCSDHCIPCVAGLEFNHESLISTGEDGAFEAECRGPG